MPKKSIVIVTKIMYTKLDDSLKMSGIDIKGLKIGGQLRYTVCMAVGMYPTVKSLPVNRRKMNRRKHI